MIGRVCQTLNDIGVRATVGGARVQFWEAFRHVPPLPIEFRDSVDFPSTARFC
jgi:hypothetical protein